MTGRTFVVGNSHVLAIKKAAALRASNHMEIRYVVDSSSSSVGGDMTPKDASALIREFSKDDTLFYCLGGAFHNINGIVTRGEPFEIAWEKELPSGSNYVGASILLHMFKEQNGVGLGQMTRGSQCRICVLATKPPLESNDAIALALQKHIKGKATGCLRWFAIRCGGWR